MADVFLSYKSEDRELVAPLAEALESEGVSVWWDKKIAAGGTWRETITDALAQAKVVVVAWSKRTEDSAAAAWVFNEVDEAQRMRLPLIPVQLEPCSIPLGYRHVQAANLSGWRGAPDHAEWQEVLSGVRAAIRGRPIGGAVRRRRSASALRRGNDINMGGVLFALAGLVVALGLGGYWGWTLLASGAGPVASAENISMEDQPDTSRTAPPPAVWARATLDTGPVTSAEDVSMEDRPDTSPAAPPLPVPPPAVLARVTFYNDVYQGEFRNIGERTWMEYNQHMPNGRRWRESDQCATDRVCLIDGDAIIEIDTASNVIRYTDSGQPGYPTPRPYYTVAGTIYE